MTGTPCIDGIITPLQDLLSKCTYYRAILCRPVACSIGKQALLGSALRQESWQEGLLLNIVTAFNAAGSLY